MTKKTGLRKNQIETDLLNQQKMAFDEVDIFLRQMDALINFSFEDIEKEIINIYLKYGKDWVINSVQSKKHFKPEGKEKTTIILYLTSYFKLRTNKLYLNIEKGVENLLINLYEKYGNKVFELLSINNLMPKLTKFWILEGKDFYKRLKIHNKKLYLKFQKSLKASFVQKDFIEKLLNKVDKERETAKNRLKGLVITESNQVLSESRKYGYIKAGIKEYKIDATLDSSTCEECKGKHGLIFPLIEYEVLKTAPPFHTRCRCHCTPII